MTLIRLAMREDLPGLHPVIERAYRGNAAKRGWTHEADLLEGDRTDMATLEGVLAAPDQRLLVGVRGDRPVACVNIADEGRGTAYLGMLCVDPVLQDAGLGRRLIAAGEAMARALFGARRIEMTVIAVRTELIAYYGRRGYAPTGERRDFVVPVDPPLFMTVLAKRLG